MGPVALAIATGYGLVTLGILSRGRLREPWILGAVVSGAIAFPVVLLLGTPIQQLFAAVFRWDMDAYTTSLGIGLVGVAATATVSEVFKLAAALLVWSFSGERGDALAFGAGAGAGFGIVGAYQVILLALMARTLPISSPGGFAASLVQQFAFVAVSTATTALAAHGLARRRLGTYLAVAILGESVFTALGLLFTLRVYTNPVWTFLSVGIGLGLLTCVFLLSLTPSAPDQSTPDQSTPA